MPYKDPEKRREYQKAWIANRRAAFFTGKVCVRCGSDDELELDHVNPALKVDHRIWSWSEERRLEELDKCQILCGDCHLEKTIEALAVEHGGGAIGVKGCKCVPCRERKRSYNKELMRRLRKSAREQ